MSSRKFSGKFSVAASGTYRAQFAETWSRFVRAHYDSPVHVAVGVDASTADNWWAGLNAPQGWVVGRAFADPATRAAALRHLGAA